MLYFNYLLGCERGKGPSEHNTSKHCWFNVYTQLSYLNFHPPAVVSHRRDPQLQVVERYSYLLNTRPNIDKCRCLNTHFVPNNCDLI